MLHYQTIYWRGISCIYSLYIPDILCISDFPILWNSLLQYIFVQCLNGFDILYTSVCNKINIQLPCLINHVMWLSGEYTRILSGISIVLLRKMANKPVFHESSLPLVMKMEMVIKILVCSLFIYLTWQVAQESFIVLSRHRTFRLPIHMLQSTRCAYNYTNFLQLPDVISMWTPLVTHCTKVNAYIHTVFSPVLINDILFITLFQRLLVINHYSWLHWMFGNHLVVVFVFCVKYYVADKV